MILATATEQIALHGATWSEHVMEFLRGLPHEFSEVPAWQCAVLIPVGLVSLLCGLRLFRGMVVVYSVLLGAVGGWYLAGAFSLTSTLHQFLCLGCGAVLLGICGWMFVQVIFGLMSGVAGALAGVALLYATDNVNMILIAAGVGFVVGIVLAVIIFRALVVATTAILGSYMVVTGIVVLLYYVPQVKTALVKGFTEHHYLLPLLIAIPAVIGVIYQTFQLRAEENK
ncbi:MAG: hypothetical protein QGD94_05245 [Planctomycetia bacterium]|nr:hypothetical protein [Planctomycetia bacterium]